MRMSSILLLALFGALSGAGAKEYALGYTLSGLSFEGTLVVPDGAKNLPALVMVPNWLGPTEQSLEKARRIAASGYVVYMVDMYGTQVRPQNMEEAGAASGAVKADRAVMRERINKAVSVFQAEAPAAWNGEHLAAIGFCFGGTTVLELARSGNSDVQGVVCFHGHVDTPVVSDAGNIACSVLVLHGANDPFITAKDLLDFQTAMQATDVDFTFIAYNNTVHSFTDPYATWAGKAEYNAQSNDRAFAAMGLALAEWFGVPVKTAPSESAKGGFLWIRPGEPKKPGSMGKK